MSERNPLCACGCGLEVRLPTNRFICGHTGPFRKLTQTQVEEIRGHLADGEMSKNAIGRMYGVSGTHIAYFDSRKNEGFVPLTVGGYHTASEIELGILINKSRRMKNQIKRVISARRNSK